MNVLCKLIWMRLRFEFFFSYLFCQSCSQDFETTSGCTDKSFQWQQEFQPYTSIILWTPASVIILSLPYQGTYKKCRRLPFMVNTVLCGISKMVIILILLWRLSYQKWLHHCNISNRNEQSVMKICIPPVAKVFHREIWPIKRWLLHLN